MLLSTENANRLASVQMISPINLNLNKMCLGIIWMLLIARSDICLAMSALQSASDASRASQQQAVQPAPEPQELDRLLDEGAKAEASASFPAAIKAYEIGLTRAQALGDEKRTARFLNGLGNAYNGLGQYAKAADRFNSLLSIVKKLGQPQPIAAALADLGTAYYGLGQSDKALEYHKQALKIREGLGGQNDIAGSLAALGNIYKSTDRYEASLDCLNRALDIREKLGNPQDIAHTYANLGGLYVSMGQFDRAFDYIDHAQSIFEKLGNPQEISYGLTGLGVVNDSLGRYDKALEYYKQALGIRERLGNQRDVAISLGGVGGCYYELGQYVKALEYSTRAESIREHLGNQQYIADSNIDLGNIYADMGQFEKSLEYYDMALSIYKKQEYPEGIAGCLNNRGEVYASDGRYSTALDCFNQALTIRRKLGNPQDIAESLDDLAGIYTSTGNHAQAITIETEALTLREQLHNNRDIAKSLNNLANACGSQGRIAEALKFFNRAVQLRLQLGNQLDIASSLADLGTLFHSQHRLKDAVQAFKDAQIHFERGSEQALEPAQVGSFQRTLPHFYARRALLSLEQQRPLEALALSDSGRAQGLAQQAAQSRSDFSQLFSAADAQRWKQANTELTTANILRTTAQQRSDTAEQQNDEREKTAARKQLERSNNRAEQAERRIIVLRSELLHRYPRFRQLKGFQPLDAAQLKRLAAQHPDTLFLHYDIVDDFTTLLFALSAEHGLRTFTLPVGDKALATMTRQWRNDITAETQLEDPSTASDKIRELQRQILQEPVQSLALYDALVLPLEKARLLQSARSARLHLVIVADGPLLDIPFAALLDSQHRRLIERYPLSMSVSLGFLTWPTRVHASQGSLFFAADPIGPKGERLSTHGDILQRMGGFNPLPGARAGAEQIAKLFPGAFGLTGSQASKQKVLQQITRYAVLLFATHGWLDATDGLRSWLLLAPPTGGSEADGLLFAREILGMRLSARLAVLMACQSGLGQFSGGEGLEGLVWAFWAAGCGSVVGSEWEVEESATTRLMVLFYQRLRLGERKDDALRFAMLEVGRVPIWKNPFYWSSFCVYGDTAALPDSLIAGRKTAR